MTVANGYIYAIGNAEEMTGGFNNTLYKVSGTWTPETVLVMASVSTGILPENGIYFRESTQKS